MSPELNTVLAKAGEPQIELTSVSLHKGQNHLVARFRSDSLISLERMSRIEREISELLPGINVEADFEFPNAKQELEQEFSHCSTLIQDAISGETEEITE